MANPSGPALDGRGGVLLSPVEGRIYRTPPGGCPEKILDVTTRGAGCADFGYAPESGTLVVPTFQDNRVFTYHPDEDGPRRERCRSRPRRGYGEAGLGVSSGLHIPLGVVCDRLRPHLDPEVCVLCGEHLIGDLHRHGVQLTRTLGGLTPQVPARRVYIEAPAATQTPPPVATPNSST
jgi:hypothetical protein